MKTYTAVDIFRAEDMARIAHGEQKYGNYPYEKHLKDVVYVLKEFGFIDPEWAITGWLHDTLEDTNTTREDIDLVFGDDITNLVLAVTTKSGNRRQRQEQLLCQLQAYPKAVPLKLADRIANVRHCWETRSPLLFMYRKEYNHFQAIKAIRVPHPSVALEMMWRELDNLHGYTQWTKNSS